MNLIVYRPFAVKMRETKSNKNAINGVQTQMCVALRVEKNVNDNIARIGALNLSPQKPAVSGYADEE